jgi:excisionase family DNA binding protein
MSDKEFLTKDDVVRDYGIAKRTLERWMSVRMIPYIKIGKLVRFLPRDLEKFIEAHRVR